MATLPELDGLKVAEFLLLEPTPRDQRIGSALEPGVVLEAGLDGDGDWVWMIHVRGSDNTFLTRKGAWTFVGCMSSISNPLYNLVTFPDITAARAAWDKYLTTHPPQTNQNE